MLVNKALCVEGCQSDNRNIQYPCDKTVTMMTCLFHFKSKITSDQVKWKQILIRLIKAISRDLAIWVRTKVSFRTYLIKNLTLFVCCVVTYNRGILCMHPANERWCYLVTSSPIGWAHTQNDPWFDTYFGRQSIFFAWLSKKIYMVYFTIFYSIHIYVDNQVFFVWFEDILLKVYFIIFHLNLSWCDKSSQTSYGCMLFQVTHYITSSHGCLFLVWSDMFPSNTLRQRKNVRHFVDNGFPSQKASNVENISIYAYRHVLLFYLHNGIKVICDLYTDTASNINTLRLRQNGRRFADDTFKCTFLNENVRISIKISLKFVPKGPINNNPALVQIMAWRRSGDKPLSEPMMVSLLTHICVTRPQWVNSNNFLFFINNYWPWACIKYNFTEKNGSMLKQH